jgi:hypothetical protein
MRWAGHAIVDTGGDVNQQFAENGPKEPLCKI